MSVPSERPNAFDTPHSSKHPRGVLNVCRRVSAVLVTLALAVSNTGACFGWLSTPEARMACCSEGAECPMHKSDTHNSEQSRTQSQTTADNCCAASEKDSAPLPSPLVLDGAIALVASPVQVLAPTTAIQPQSGRTIPLPGAQVPKHLLLSVFLV